MVSLCYHHGVKHRRGVAQLAEHPSPKELRPEMYFYSCCRSATSLKRKWLKHDLTQYPERVQGTIAWSKSLV